MYHTGIRMSRIEKPQLGEWRTFTHKLIRRSAMVNPKSLWWQMRELPEPMNGMFIGSRTVWDGVAKFDTEFNAEGTFYGKYNFAGHTHHEVWLFVIAERRNPIIVNPIHVLRINLEEISHPSSDA